MMKRIFLFAVTLALLVATATAQHNPTVRTRGVVTNGALAVFDDVSGRYIKAMSTNEFWLTWTNTFYRINAETSGWNQAEVNSSTWTNWAVTWTSIVYRINAETSGWNQAEANALVWTNWAYTWTSIVYRIDAETNAWNTAVTDSANWTNWADTWTSIVYRIDAETNAWNTAVTDSANWTNWAATWTSRVDRMNSRTSAWDQAVTDSANWTNWADTWTSIVYRINEETNEWNGSSGFYGGYVTVVRTVDWEGWEIDEGSLGDGTNNVVFTGYSTRDATNLINGGWAATCSRSVQNDKYVYSYPSWFTNMYVGPGGINIDVRSSSTNSATNKFDCIIVDGFNAVTTNGLVSTTADEWETFNIPQSWLPSDWTNTGPTYVRGATTNYGFMVGGDYFAAYGEKIQAVISVDLRQREQ